MDANTLYQQYQQEFTNIISAIVNQGDVAIPYVIIQILTVLLPEIAQNIGQIQQLDADDKKTLLINVIELGIDQTFAQLDNLPQLPVATWNLIRQIIIALIGPILDNLIAVQNGNLVINSTISSFFSCCK